eukprot:Pgem_evm1s15719
MDILYIKIIFLFVLFFAGCFSCVIYATKNRNGLESKKGQLFFTALQLFAATCILYIGLVHMLLEGAETLEKKTGRHFLGGLICAIGFFAMYFMHNSLDNYCCQNLNGQCNSHNHSDNRNHNHNNSHNDIDTDNNDTDTNTNNDDNMQIDNKQNEANVSTSINIDIVNDQSRVHAIDSTTSSAFELENNIDNPQHHTHKSELVKNSHVTMIYLGLFIHSLFEGIPFGCIEQGNFSVNFYIAFSFHKLLEGIVMGYKFIDTSYKPWLVYSMLVLFSLATPIGLALGIGFSNLIDNVELLSGVVLAFSLRNPFSARLSESTTLHTSSRRSSDVGGNGGFI